MSGRVQAVDDIDDGKILEAACGDCIEVHILLPNGMVVLKSIYLMDIHGVDLTVKQMKQKLIKDLHLQDIEPNNVSLVLKKGIDQVIMNDDAKAVDYIHKVTDQYLLQIIKKQH